MTIRPPGGTDDSSKAPIVVGNVAPVGSPILDYPQIPAALRAGVAALNDAGGINGHPVELVTCNSKADANQDVACARELADAGAIAAVGSFIVFGADGYEQVLDGANIADLAPYGVSPASFQGTNTFPITSNNGNLAGCLSRGAVELTGATKVAIVGLDVPTVPPIIDLLKSTADTVGLEVSAIVKVPATASDLAPYARQAAEGGAELVGGACSLPRPPRVSCSRRATWIWTTGTAAT